MKNVGRFISERRKLLGISQQDLAGWLDVTNKDISQWESGETFPDITSIAGLAACLQLSADELLATKLKPKTEDELSRINTDFINLCVYNKLDEARELWQEGYIDLSFTYAGSTALLMATQKGHVEMVNWLVEIGSPLDATSTCKKTSLIHAVQRGHIEIVKTLINAGANTSAQDREGKKAKDYANPKKHAEIIGMLTSQKTDASMIQQEHTAPALVQPKTKKELSDINSKFIYLCEYNKLDEAIELWQEGDIDLSFAYAGSTALLMATQKGHIDMVNWLVEIGSPLDATSTCKKTSLIHAVQRGHIEIVKTLINAGANTNAQDRAGKRAKDYANPKKHAEIIEMLTSQKSNASMIQQERSAPAPVLPQFTVKNPSDLAKKSPMAKNIVLKTEIARNVAVEARASGFKDIANLSQAVADGSKDGTLDAARYYISQGEDVEQLLSGKPLLAHAMSEDNLEMAKVLIDGGANVNASWNDGFGLLHGACKKLAFSQCVFLLENGADPNKTDKNGNTPLHFAVCPPNNKVSASRFKAIVSGEQSPTYVQAIEIVDLLLKKGANLEAVNHRGHTPFFTMFTLKDSSFELIKHLAELGAMVDIQDEDGNTCLHYAIASEDENQLRLLLEKGADMHVLNFNGFSPYEFALKKNKPSIVSLVTRM